MTSILTSEWSAEQHTHAKAWVEGIVNLYIKHAGERYTYLKDHPIYYQWEEGQQLPYLMCDEWEHGLAIEGGWATLATTVTRLIDTGRSVETWQ